MLSHLCFKWKLWGLFRKRSLIEKEISEEGIDDKRTVDSIVAIISRDTSSEEMHKALDELNEIGLKQNVLVSNMSLRKRVNEIEDQIDLLTTSNLIQVAAKLMVPVPGYDQNIACWKPLRNSLLKHVLSASGIDRIRKTIRDERRARIEYFGILSGIIIGMTGALTGLMAVILR